VADEHAGKRVKCPGCQAILTVPAAGAASAPPPPLVQRTPSAPPPPVPPPPSVGVQPSASAPPWPSSPPPPRPRRGSAIWVFLLIGVVLLVVGGAIVLFFVFGGGAPDLAYVPGDAQGFASVRVADLWKSAAVKDAMKKLPQGMTQESVAALMEAAVGLKPEDIERATLVFQDAEKGVGWGVVALNKPVEQKDLLSKLGKLPPIGELKEATHKGKTYHVSGQGPQPFAIHFATNKIVILGPEDGVKRCLEGEGGKPSGLLGRGVSAASGKKDIVIAFAFTDKMKEQLRKEMPPGDNPFSALLEAQGVLIQGTLDSKLALEATLSFPNEDKAKAGKTAVELAKSFGQISLAQLRKAPNMADLGPMMDKAEGVLKDLTIDQSGSDVRVQVKVDADTLVAGPGLLLPAVQKVRVSASRTTSQLNLQQLALAMHSYADNNRTLPPSVKYGPDGKPLWSWRVELLPYVEEGAMYQALNQNEPWDSPHNAQVLARMPKVYQMPGKPENGMTYYQVFQGKGGLFDAAAKQGPSIAMIQNGKGTSNTILIAESATPVQWAAPGDITVAIDPNNPSFDPRALGGHFGDDINVALADGSKKMLKRSMSPRTLGWAITGFTALPPPRDW
jgi:hypothetical protein